MKEEWFVLEDFLNGTPLICTDYMNVKKINNFLKKIKIKNKITKTLTEYKIGHTYLCLLKKEFDDLSKEIVDKIIKDPTFFIKGNAEMIKQSDSFFQTSKNILAINLFSLKNKDLLILFKKFFSAYELTHIIGWPQNTADFGEGLLSKYLLNYLKLKIKDKRYSVSEVFVKLTTPTEMSNAQKEYKNLLFILKYIKDNKNLIEFFSKRDVKEIDKELRFLDSKLNQLINKHVLDYGYLGYGFIGPAWNRAYFIDILASLVKQNADVNKLNKENDINNLEIKNSVKKLIKELKIDKRHQKIFEVAKGFVYTKGYRKDSMFYYFWIVENVLNEFVRRNNLSFIQIQYTHPREFDKFNNLKSVELDKRFEHCVFYSTGDYKTDLILTGKKAKDFLKNLSFLKEEITEVTQLNGSCASPGKARGICKIVNITEDMKKMEQGNILISIVTNPDLVPAMKKAAAIITNIGGITCHAAIVSRELGIPCIIGTRIATKVLKDGDLVDVDATHGRIIILKKQ